jgi:hypothetical protein
MRALLNVRAFVVIGFLTLVFLLPAEVRAQIQPQEASH